MARLFVAVWPPQEVADALARLPRPQRSGVRWTSPEQWHVTLRFLGEADPDAAAAALAAVATAATVAGAPAELVLGPAAARLGRQALVLPAAGVESLADAVAAATATIGRPPEPRRFRGHLTLARLRPGSSPGDQLHLEARWPVHSVALVQSHLRPTGATYETMAEVALGSERLTRAGGRRPAPRRA